MKDCVLKIEVEVHHCEINMDSCYIKNIKGVHSVKFFQLFNNHCSGRRSLLLTRWIGEHHYCAATMDRHKKVTCRICLKQMRSDALKRHMKQHENKPIDEVTEKVEYNSTLDVAALKNNIVWKANEYQRKLELGREIKQIVQELHVPTACLDKEQMEALELFENRGQVKEIKPAEWRPWQYELKEYANNPTARRIIWVVGKKGNEGKSFFQNQIEEQYRLH